MDPIVIIGTGLAGYNLAKELRKLDKQVPLQLITADSGESYSKPMLSNALSKGKTARQLILSSAEQMAGQLAATIQANTLVEKIDPDGHTLDTSSGKVNYSKLVLAVGASQISPPLQGNAVAEIITVNNLNDYSGFRDVLEGAQHVAIIGPGLIGCEFANDLVSVNKDVTVIGPGVTPLDRLLPPSVGELVMNELSNAGVNWRLGVTATEVNRSNNHYHITMSDGAEIVADLVLSAVGLQPNIALAKEAGLKVNRGIVVNRLLQTSATDIYALGDCIEIEGMVLPFVLPLMNAARTLAKTLTGTETRISYPAMPVVIKTPVHPIVVSAPEQNAQGDWQIEIDEAGARALFQNHNGALLGFVLTGDKVNEKQALSKLLPPVLS